MLEQLNESTQVVGSTGVFVAKTKIYVIRYPLLLTMDKINGSVSTDLFDENYTIEMTKFHGQPFVIHWNTLENQFRNAFLFEQISEMTGHKILAFFENFMRNVDCVFKKSLQIQSSLDVKISKKLDSNLELSAIDVNIVRQTTPFVNIKLKSEVIA